MNKSDLAKNMAEIAGTTLADSERNLNAFLESVMQAVANGESVQIPGFGVYQAKHRAERQGRNPKTGEPLTIAASIVPGFKPGKQFKEKVQLVPAEA